MGFVRIAVVLVSVLGASICYGQEFVECLDDSDCNRGPCVDGQCVSRGPDLPSQQGRGSERSAEWYRSKVEWCGFRILGGNYGFGMGYGLVTLRWRHFFWEVLRAQLGGRPNAEYLQFGSGVGVPVHFGTEGKHELRFALAVLFGKASQDESNGESGVYYACWGCDSGDADLGLYYNTPVHLVPAISYVAHLAPYFALEIGVDLSIGLSNKSDYDYASPVFNGFIGLRI